MSEVIRKSVPNEILIRFDLSGKVQGVHLQMATYLEVGGEVLPETLKTEMPKDFDYNNEVIKELLGPYCAELMAENARLMANISVAES